jgi:hypothetical protein
MTYRERQRIKAVNLRDEMFKDPGDGAFHGHKYEFVLEDPFLNLWPGIREDSMEYFKRNKIPWWMGDDEPTGHLLSSQIACVNHLYHLRQRKDLVTAILKNIDSRIVEAEIIDDGYVEFEVIGKCKNYLNEAQHTRGANSTSIDAFMVGKKTDGKNVLFLIEWKYTEFYEKDKSLLVPAREIYIPLLLNYESPIKQDFAKVKFEPLYYEPFYQLMRQTLLGWKMAKAGEYNSDEYIHLHIVPKENAELRYRNTSPNLQGKDMESAWQNILKEPFRYKLISPQEFFVPLEKERDTKSLLQYLKKRYWSDEA